jgi:hypothetical protein
MLVMLACGDPEPTEYDVPLRSDAEVRELLEAACGDSTDRRVPMLVEFSAAWCSDCRKLHRMKQRGPLADELEEWPTVVINLDQFDRHVDLLSAFGVERIAHWAVLAPTDCSEPVERWPRIVQRTLEPSSGAEQGTSPADFAVWLAGLRTR